MTGCMTGDAYNISEDGGRTWKRFFGAVKVGDREWFDETMVVERKDGTLWMLARTKSEERWHRPFPVTEEKHGFR
ncbi:MAG: sialidase family protein [Clostridia bacterium]